MMYSYDIIFAFRQVNAVHREEVKELVAEKACQLLQKKCTKSFRIFSIGCGDGTFDIKILQTISDRFPDIKVHYIGTDIDEKSCQQARELLGSVQNVEVEILAEDYQRIDPAKINIPPCDLVLAVHIFYYMKDIKKALIDAQTFRKSDGMFNTLFIPYSQKIWRGNKFGILAVCLSTAKLISAEFFSACMYIC